MSHAWCLLLHIEGWLKIINIQNSSVTHQLAKTMNTRQIKCYPVFDRLLMTSPTPEGWTAKQD